MEKKQYRLMFENEDQNWWFLAKRKFIRTVLPNPNVRLNILDVGCGTGGTTKFLEKYGKVSGLEPSSFARIFLKQRKIRFKTISVESFTSGKKFDLICFLDVLYHKNIRSDMQAIKKAAGILNTGGYLLITDCALPYFSGPHDKNMFARQRYKLGDMQNMVNNSGFTLLKSSYTYFFTFPLFILTRIIQNKYYFESVSKLPGIINKFLLFICTVEALFLKYVNFPVGSSIIVYAQKNK